MKVPIIKHPQEADSAQRNSFWWKLVYSPVCHFFLILEAQSLRCRCSTHSCPGDHNNETCTTEGQCYKKVEPGSDDSIELITYGCLPPEEKTRMQCNTPDHVHKKQLSMECCRNGDMCNTLLQPSLPTTPSPTTGRVLSVSCYWSSELSSL